MKIKELHIKRFRGIEDQTIKDIDSALVLIGKNNAGKSAFLATTYLREKIYIRILMILRLK